MPFRSLPKLDNCLNCGNPVNDNFCSHCGQENEDQTSSIKSVMDDFLDDIAHFDSKLFLTIVPLLFKPGFLTNEYNKGRRIRYVSPYRIYLFVTFLFFLLFSFSSASKDMVVTSHSSSTSKSAADLQRAKQQINQSLKDVNTDSDNKVSAAIEKMALLKARNAVDAASVPAAKSADSDDSDDGSINVDEFGGKSDTINFDTLPKTVQQYEIEQASPANHHKDRWLVKWIKEKVILYRQDPAAFKSNFTDSLEDDLPKMVFFIVPLFAVWLKLMYLRQRRYYVEHLIFSLHNHAFVFICFTVMILTKPPFQQFFHLSHDVGDIIDGVMWVSIAVYLFGAMKRVYKQSIGKTFIKYFIAMWGYSVLLTVAFLLTLLYAIIGTQ